MLRRLGADKRGVAGLEFAIAAPLLIFCVMNAADMGYYMYSRMEVENAAQMGAQAAWNTCNSDGLLPATQNCPQLTSAVTAVTQRTTLGTAVAIASGYPTEGYYCANSANQFQYVGDVSSEPANCSAAGNANVGPGDYLNLKVAYTYKPMFPGITVISAMAKSPITATSWVRLG
jgi:Flp pilus assembly protein TadG